MDTALDTHQKYGRELHKNATSYVEQILEATLQKQQLYGHLLPIS